MHIDDDGFMNYVVDDLAISPNSNKVLEKVWEKNGKEKINENSKISKSNST